MLAAGWQIHKLPAGHNAMVIAPRQVAAPNSPRRGFATDTLADRALAVAPAISPAPRG